MATMVHEGLFVGNASDIYKFAGSVLHCARDPWFEQAKTTSTLLWKNGMPDKMLAPQWIGNNVIRVGYNEMALNMVDAESPKYFSDEMVNAGLDFITERMAEGDPVLVHCSMGLSRSPSIAMLWLWDHGFLDNEFRYAIPQFKELYPDYNPSNGIWQYLKNRIESAKG